MYTPFQTTYAEEAAELIRPWKETNYEMESTINVSTKEFYKSHSTNHQIQPYLRPCSVK
jgi:hypothetical protein